MIESGDRIVGSSINANQSVAVILIGVLDRGDGAISRSRRFLQHLWAAAANQN
jgi:hypothetical protein